MEEMLLSPETCMQFLIWSYYYHNIIPEKNISFASYKKFSQADVVRLDELKNTLFLSYEEQSIRNACAQFRQAKLQNEPCPYTQLQLDSMFASEL
ncbi:MAG: hypothetical protein MJ197_01575 [Bacteroidales bacterium]|nr:hypothetical protein [Bacteroidales bacterium]